LLGRLRRYYAVSALAILGISALLAAQGHALADSPLAFRGTAGSLPFHLGTTLYNGAWAGFAKTDRSADWWWYDKEHWRKLFKQFSDAHLNTIVYWHPHPYVGFIRFGEFPEAAYLSPEETERRIEMFRWITAEGKKHGVSIYFEIWNICLPPGFCKAHGLKEFGADTPLVREYTRYVVKELFRTYPDLGGLVTMAAESPPGCTDFVLNTIVPGMKDSVGGDSPRKTLPTLIYWTWCSYPEDGKKILDAYPGEKYVLHYLQYEQFFKPMADPRILMTSEAFGGLKVIAMGGLGTACGWFYSGDPFFIQKTMQDLVRKNGGGILFSGTDSFAAIAERWIAREAFERYSWKPSRPDTPAYWEGRIAERYGNREIAKPLLRAMVDSSNIIPRFMCLVHSQTDHYNPQIGMPLVNYIEMPTLSTYVFENHDYIDEKGRLYPNVGLTWPNPDWGEDVISIRDYVRMLGVGLIPVGKGCEGRRPPTTPVAIADELQKLSLSALDAIRSVRPRAGGITERRNELVNTLKLMEMNSCLGLHYAEKIRAGIAWEAWKQGAPANRPADILAHLDKSIGYWRALCHASKEVVPNPVFFWQCRTPAEPPWDHWDIWNNYHWVKVHWRDITPLFEKERELVGAWLSSKPETARLPLFPELEAALLRTEPVADFDFEGEWPEELVANPPGAEIVAVTDEVEHVISGRRSVLCDTRGSEAEWNLFPHTSPSKLRLAPGEKYVVEFDWRIVDPGKGRYPFSVAARTDTGGPQKDVGTYRYWGGKAGQTGHKAVTLEPRDYEDYYLFFRVQGKAAIVLDNIKISQVVR